MLEGPPSAWANRRIKREAILGAMLTLSVVYGIPILRSQSEEETARLVRFTALQLQVIPTKDLHRPGRRPRGKRALQIRVLSSLPRVGPMRAKRLLDTFSTLERIVATTAEDLAAVPGIGKRTAQSIHWAVHEDCLSCQR